MQESSVIQHFTELGIEQGERKGIPVDVLEVKPARSYLKNLRADQFSSYWKSFDP